MNFVWLFQPPDFTQRKKWRESVFFTDNDFQTYLTLLKDYRFLFNVDALAYWLLSHPIPLVAIRYRKRNPVRARLVPKPENYPWSSSTAPRSEKMRSAAQKPFEEIGD